MKMIIGMIQPFKLQDVTLALASLSGFPGMTVSEARGFGREHLEVRGDRLEELTDFTQCVRIEIIVEDELLDSVVDTLLRAAHTGRRGDGKVAVYELEGYFDVRLHPGDN
jgi:nitrogen regulatory protein P-II 1